MPDFGVELHFGRHVGILVWDFDVDLELSALVDGIARAVDYALPVLEVVVYEPNFELSLIRELYF